MPLSDKKELNALLSKAGIDSSTATAVMEIDALLQQWRRRAMKRELANTALADLKVGIDLAQFDVLAVVEAPTGEATGETMVATVAERLAIDPSRASRLVSEMVEKGFARRAVSQADARRTIIELTDQGRSVVDAVRAYKFLIMGEFLGAWDKAELETFVPMLKRFSSWMDGLDLAMEKHAGAIAELAAGVSRADEAEIA